MIGQRTLIIIYAYFPLLYLLHTHLCAAHALDVRLPRSTGFYVHSEDGNFTHMARQAGTDKVEPHNFHFLYQKYFELSCRRPALTKMMEIGLGCDMQYGPGKSAILWRKFFPEADIWFAEYDSACVSKFRDKLEDLNVRVVGGDQANIMTLKEWVSVSGGNFDVIIDDGGHRQHQIYRSLLTLFDQALKPGGLYVIEDLHVSRDVEYSAEGRTLTMMDILKDWIEILVRWTTPSFHVHRFRPMPLRVKSIECSSEACALTKCYDDDSNCDNMMQVVNSPLL
ncbi:hypothetical protein DUNSADRAFT_12568 [Dunaliella salina]|uniref:Uncharacterized protein n=1 Tax=Dunaliella salina TaxID=3046 RepID=A0ABQ7GB15_DUNSA|nr:hypothetical protein DUNSADRAFT_12568 [Dunaliella salina]|eukprot:KAF5831800.1 hypothetical protein DUNSADRAFT_12568 [Dunaliella salina]